MEFNYGIYDANKATVIETPDKTCLFVYPSNMNPFKLINMACYRNDDNQVVISLMEENSVLYTPDEWKAMSKTLSLKTEYENKMLEVISSAQDARQHFLQNEK